ncbi:hypothetical protein F383_34982 [Gossypium arboreum]|uniref:Uncharacterized protein n=1 Tax=Gossypium arboreum TaxID=29729 RepID=A0A0B0PQK7_GOSAR|nr:hypothetical protein F383_34982 [Gossypium arboreum]
MPLSHTGSYTTHISIPTSQIWSYTRTHIENPMS